MPRATAAVLLAVLALLAGCSSTEKRAETASSDILATQLEIQQGEADVVVALGKLDALTHRDPTDLDDRLEEYEEALERLDEAAARIRDRAERMRASGDGYFDAWSRELSGAGEESAADHAQRLRDYRAVQQGSAALRDAYRPFVARLRSIRDTLKQPEEPTQEHVKALAPQIRQVKDMGVEVQRRAVALEDSLRSLADKVRASGRR